MWGKKCRIMYIFRKNTNIKIMIYSGFLDFFFFGHINYLLLNTELLSNFHESWALLTFPLKCFIIPWFEQVVSLEGALTDYIRVFCQGQKGWKLFLTADCNEPWVHNMDKIPVNYFFLKFYSWFMKANELEREPGSGFLTVH